MKKSLLALAVLGAYAGVASAQSSVTLYGTVDLNGRYVKNDGSRKRLSLGRDGINSSQLGFRGIEDLGGGLKAGFLLLSSVGADSGDIGAGQSGGAYNPATGSFNTGTPAAAGTTGNANAGSGKFWTRRATVSLFSNAGELRLGRDYTPTFWNNTIFDAFGTNGLGDSSHVLQLATTTFVRADNAVQYFLPANIGGFYGQATVAAAEPGQAGQGSNNGRYIGGRIGFAAGPFDIAFAAADQKNVTFPINGNDQRTYNLGGAYDLGFLKLMGYVVRDKRDNARETRGSISAVIPMGQGEVHVGYDRSKLKNSVVPAAPFNNTAWQAKATYQYNLSKRTAMYGTIATLDNGARSALSVSSGTSQTLAPTLGGKSKGFELGVRHFF
jgi:predicted porin